MQSDLMLLLAGTTPAAEAERRSDGISCFLVDLREAVGNGIELRKLDAMINHNSCEVSIDGLEVLPECLIGEEGRGFRYILDGMHAERVLIAHQSLGCRLLRPRRSRPGSASSSAGRPIGQNQGVQFPIVRAWAAGEAAMQTFGGFAFAREYGIERKWREARYTRRRRSRRT